MVIFVLIVYGLGSALFCAWLAIDKGRNPVAWGFFGLIFGLPALLAIAAMPLVKDEVTNPGTATAAEGGPSHRQLEEAAARHRFRDPRPWIKE